MTSAGDIEAQFGPNYDIDSAALRKFRRAPDPDRKAYGAAVEAAVLSKQRSALARVTSTPRASCASGTFFSDGRNIDKAIRSQQHAALAACPTQERRARTPEQWQSMYDDAMERKRNGKL